MTVSLLDELVEPHVLLELHLLELWMNRRDGSLTFQATASPSSRSGMFRYD
jgi:hypothetical protein